MQPDETSERILLVEGASDAIAITTLARRLGVNLAAEGVSVIEMGGATQIGMYFNRYGPPGLGLRLAGLFDVGEAREVGRILGRAGTGSPHTPQDQK